MNRQTHSSGFSLIEGLVALTILSVGLLGISTMSIQSIRNSNAAQLRTKAVFFAADMADRVRTNKLALTLDPAAYVSGVGDNGTDGGCTDSVDGAGNVIPAANVCTPVEMAEHDIFLWKDLVTDDRNGLPGAEAAIERVGSQPVRLTLSVFWQEQGEPQRYDLRMQILPPPAPAAP
ncbi:MAG: type IV pilus modification protein PilV [Pseudomonadota bacterium]